MKVGGEWLMADDSGNRAVLRISSDAGDVQCETLNSDPDGPCREMQKMGKDKCPNT